MTIEAARKYYTDTLSSMQVMWQKGIQAGIQHASPLAVKATIIGIIVHRTLGAYATAVYLAAAVVLHHKHDSIINQISKITVGDIALSIITAVSPFFGTYGIISGGVLLLTHTITKNIQMYKVLAKYSETLEKLKVVEAKNEETKKTLDKIIADAKTKEQEYAYRIAVLDAYKEDCKKTAEESNKVFSEIRELLDSGIADFSTSQKKEVTDHILAIEETLQSNQAVWKVLAERHR